METLHDLTDLERQSFNSLVKQQGWENAVGFLLEVDPQAIDADTAAKIEKIALKSFRPLNSFMAFRTHYTPIFKCLQQKERSGIVTFMWKNDPFKAKWAILAKSYSIIRTEQTKAEAPLHTFLAIVCTFLKIVNPEDYLSLGGFALLENKFGGLTIYQSAPACFDESLMSSTASVFDVVQHCINVGFAYVNMPGILALAEASDMTMSTGTDLTIGASEPFKDDLDTESLTMVEDDPIPGYIDPQLMAWLDEDIETDVISETSQLTHVESQADFIANNLETLVPAHHLRQNTAPMHVIEGEYPFNTEFSTNSQENDFYDPMAGDDFNANSIWDFPAQ